MQLKEEEMLRKRKERKKELRKQAKKRASNETSSPRAVSDPAAALDPGPGDKKVVVMSCPEKGTIDLYENGPYDQEVMAKIEEMSEVGKVKMGFDRAGTSTTHPEDEDVDWADADQIRASKWMYGFKTAAKAIIKTESQGFCGLLEVLCINGGPITQVEAEEMQKIVNNAKKDAAKSHVKVRIQLTTMSYYDFLREYDTPARSPRSPRSPTTAGAKSPKKPTGKKTGIHSAGAAGGAALRPENSVFVSLRFGESHGVQPMAEELQAALKPKGVDAKIINMTAGGNIHEEVFSQIEACSTFVAFGSKHYGEDTGNSAST
eukprot:COSAG04_NODE_6066_length_1419_cov_1.087121_2_plen_317_part_01